MSKLYYHMDHSYRSLEPYGISVLTGESCAFGMRLLCDLNQKGIDLVSAFFGLPTDAKFEKNWNTTVQEYGDAVASMVLGRKTLEELRIFIAFYIEQCTVIIVTADGSIHGTWSTDREFLEDYRSKVDLFGDGAYFKNNGWDYVWSTKKQVLPEPGGRNVHQFSGRTS